LSGILPKSRTEADHESFALDSHGETARRVIDNETHDKLDEVVTAIENIEVSVTLDNVTVSNEVEIKNDIGNPVPVSIDDLPLPDGAATELTLGAVLAAVDQLEPKLDSLLTELQQKTEPSDNQNVQATNLDIRDLSFAADKVDVTGSTVAIGASVLPTGAATEATMVQVRDAVDQLEGYLDQVETLLTSIGSNTDGLETLSSTANGLLTQIRDNADTVETLLSDISSNTDGLETLVTTTNTLLTTLGTYLDGVEALLNSIDNKVSTATKQDTQITALELIDDVVHAPNVAVNKAALISAQLDDDNSTVTVTENNVAPLKMTHRRALHVNLRSDNSTELIGSRPASLSIPVVEAENLKYASATNNFAIAAAATDVARIIGSNTKTIRVKKVVVSGRTTSGSPVACIIKLIKYSTANTGGTSVATTAVPLDSTSAAATAVANHYTANPTLGTAVGNIATRSITFQALGLVETLIFEFQNPIVLRGAAQQLSVNFNATSVTNSSICVNFEWEEV
jgi:hypothetical protein